MTITINAIDKESLLNLLLKLYKFVSEGEVEGLYKGCKWWIDNKEVDE